MELATVLSLRVGSSPGPAHHGGAAGGSSDQQTLEDSPSLIDSRGFTPFFGDNTCEGTSGIRPCTIPNDAEAGQHLNAVQPFLTRTPTAVEMAHGIAQASRAFSTRIRPVLAQQGMTPPPPRPGEAPLLLEEPFAPSATAVAARARPSGLCSRGPGLDLRTLLFRHHNDGLASAVDVWAALLLHAGVPLDTVDRGASPGGRVLGSLASYNASVDHSPDHNHDFLLRIVYEDRAGWQCDAITALTMTGVVWGGDPIALRVLCGAEPASQLGPTTVPTAPLFPLLQRLQYWLKPQQRQNQFRQEAGTQLAAYTRRRERLGVLGAVMAAHVVLTNESWELRDIPPKLKDKTCGLSLTLVAVILRNNTGGHHFTLTKVKKTGQWQFLCGMTRDGVGEQLRRGGWPHCLDGPGSERFCNQHTCRPVVASYGCNSPPQWGPRLQSAVPAAVMTGCTSVVTANVERAGPRNLATSNGVAEGVARVDLNRLPTFGWLFNAAPTAYARSLQQAARVAVDPGRHEEFLTLLDGRGRGEWPPISPALRAMYGSAANYNATSRLLTADYTRLFLGQWSLARKDQSGVCPHWVGQRFLFCVDAEVFVGFAAGAVTEEGVGDDTRKGRVVTITATPGARVQREVVLLCDANGANQPVSGTAGRWSTKHGVVQTALHVEWCPTDEECMTIRAPGCELAHARHLASTSRVSRDLDIASFEDIGLNLGPTPVFVPGPMSLPVSGFGKQFRMNEMVTRYVKCVVRAPGDNVLALIKAGPQPMHINGNVALVDWLVSAETLPARSRWELAKAFTGVWIGRDGTMDAWVKHITEERRLLQPRGGEPLSEPYNRVAVHLEESRRGFGAATAPLWTRYPDSSRYLAFDLVATFLFTAAPACYFRSHDVCNVHAQFRLGEVGMSTYLRYRLVPWPLDAAFVLCNDTIPRQATRRSHEGLDTLTNGPKAFIALRYGRKSRTTSYDLLTESVFKANYGTDFPAFTQRVLRTGLNESCSWDSGLRAVIGHRGPLILESPFTAGISISPSMRGAQHCLLRCAAATYGLAAAAHGVTGAWTRAAEVLLPHLITHLIYPNGAGGAPAGEHGPCEGTTTWPLLLEFLQSDGTKAFLAHALPDVASVTVGRRRTTGGTPGLAGTRDKVWSYSHATVWNYTDRTGVSGHSMLTAPKPSTGPAGRPTVWDPSTANHNVPDVCYLTSRNLHALNVAEVNETRQIRWDFHTQ